MALPILDELQWRGLIADMANRDELERLLAPGAGHTSGVFYLFCRSD